MKVPCENCITLPICKSFISDNSELLPLLKKCSTLYKFCKKEIEFFYDIDCMLDTYKYLMEGKIVNIKNLKTNIIHRSTYRISSIGVVSYKILCGIHKSYLNIKFTSEKATCLRCLEYSKENKNENSMQRMYNFTNL